MWYTHINRGTIDSNRKNGTNNPPVKFQKGKRGKPTYAHEVSFETGKIVYDHEGTLLPCGARLVIVTEKEPVVVR